jgi:methionyl-tRNA formyltransferase
MSTHNFKFAFWGTSEVSVSVLEALKDAGFLPSLIVTTPDKPQGRKLLITPSKVKEWATLHKIETLQPEKLDDTFENELQKTSWDLFIVVAYGKIIPKKILDLPKHKSINIHYSLLPRLRGSSPVEGAILRNEKETGVSIILMDDKMDHGPLLAQEKVETKVWPPKRSELMEKMNEVANKLLVTILPQWIEGKIQPQEQDHSQATYVQMIKKEDALIDLHGDPEENFRKIMAYEEWPRAYFIENSKRVIINAAEWNNGELHITRVTPEGRKEMSYKDYLNGKKSLI